MTNQNGEQPLITQRANSDALLTSLAIINVNWETQKSTYLDNFVPFALEAMRLEAEESYSEADVRGLLARRFGLEVPVKVVGSLMGRAKRKGHVERENRRYSLSPGARDSLPDIARQQADCRRQQNHLVQRLIEFAKTRFDVDWDVETAEEGLVTHIENHAVPLLASSVRGAGYDTEEEGQGRAYIVNCFIVDLVENDPAGFAYLDQMVKGSMLASALYLPTPGNVQRRFTKTTLYLDTPIALRALGYEGAEAEQAVQQMLRLATAQGAEIACFAHSVKEMRGILESTKGVLSRTPGAESATRGVATHFRAIGAKENDLNLIIERLDRDLADHRIDVREKPEHNAALSVDEDALESLLQKRVGYFRQATLIPDLDSLTAIHRLRRGTSGPYLETCRAVLVTDNSALVRASREFFDSGRHEWPLAMLDHDVTALVWVKEPLMAPDLPRCQIIADCYAALAPSQSLWIKIAAEIDRLQDRGGISSEDVALLRYSNEAQRALMDRTLGDPGRVSAKTIQEALASAREQAAKPAAKERDLALGRAARAEASESALKWENAGERDENELLKARVERFEQREQRQRKHIEDRAEKRAELFEKGSLTLSLAVIVLGSVSFFPSVTAWLGAEWSWVLRIAAVSLVVLTGWALWGGGNIRAATESLRGRLRTWLVTRELERHGMDQPEDQLPDSDTPQG